MADEATVPAERTDSREPVCGFLVRGRFTVDGPLGSNGESIVSTAGIGRVVFDRDGRDVSVFLWRPRSAREPYPDLALEQKPVFGPGYRNR
jgi:hypothetical protein